MELLGRLEASGFATWVRESGSLWAYPLILTLHTVGLSFLVGAKAVLDLRLLGFGRGISFGALGPLFSMMWIGFIVNAASGVALFAADATVKARQGVFWIKLALIGLGIVNIRSMRALLARETASLEVGIVPSRGRLLALASLAIWAAAITAGRLMAYLI
jgi:hypothetical protein